MFYYTLPEHLSSSSVIRVGFFYSIFGFVDRCFPLVLIWPLCCLSFLLRFTDSDYIPLESSNSSHGLYDLHHELVDRYGISVSHNGHGYVASLIAIAIPYSIPLPWLFIELLTSATRRMSLVDQELLTLPKYLRSTSVF